MKLILKISLACLLATGCASKISAQTYVKLNGLYALVGVVNPAVEFKTKRNILSNTVKIFS